MRGIVALLALATGCTTIPLATVDPAPREVGPRLAELDAQRLDATSVTVTPESRTVEDHWLLDLYTWLHPRNYHAFCVAYPGVDEEARVAHLLIPDRAGPHPTLLVFPILAGSHVVSEAMAKALVHRGYAVLRLERRPLFPDEYPPDAFAAPAENLRLMLLDARRLLGWLETHPEVDTTRLAAAGVSMGGILAATLVGLDERVRAGFFIMAGGGLGELLFESAEPEVREFRERVDAIHESLDRDAFVRRAHVHTRALDPLTYAHRIDPSRVLLVSGRFDRVVPPERTRALWNAIGRPTWMRFPAGHYQLFPFFWWAVGQGADLLDRVFERS